MVGLPLHRAVSSSGDLCLKKIGTSHLGKQSSHNFKDASKTYLWGGPTLAGRLLWAKH